MCHYIMSEKEERGREEHSKIIILVQYNYNNYNIIYDIDII